MRPAVAIVAAVAIALAAGVGVWTGLAVFGPSRAPAPEIHGFMPEPAKPLPDFELVDGHGQPFRDEDFRGAWSFVYFGYTYCPDACPLALLDLAGVHAALAQAEPNVPTRFMLVSVDPARDTPERLREYVTYFDPDFTGATGPLDEIDKFATAAYVSYETPAASDGESYLVGHSSTITLLDPQGRIVAIFTPPFDAQAIAADFLEILAASR